MIKRLDLILNGKGGVGKISDCLLLHLGQTLKTAVGRLVLCKPFLATAAVWLDSAARCCGLRLRFCVRKTCPVTGTRLPSLTHRGASSGDKFRIELDGQESNNRGIAGVLIMRRAEKLKAPFGDDIRFGRFAGFDLFLHPSFNDTTEMVVRGQNSYSARVTDTALGTIRSLDVAVQGFEERAERLGLDITDASKRVKELGEKVGANFERGDRYQELSRRQSEIEEKLDLTKNQAPSQVEACENGESNGISEQPVAVHRHVTKLQRGVNV